MRFFNLPYISVEISDENLLCNTSLITLASTFVALEQRSTWIQVYIY